MVVSARRHGEGTGARAGARAGRGQCEARRGTRAPYRAGCRAREKPAGKGRPPRGRAQRRRTQTFAPPPAAASHSPRRLVARSLLWVVLCWSHESHSLMQTHLASARPPLLRARDPLLVALLLLCTTLRGFFCGPEGLSLLLRHPASRAGRMIALKPGSCCPRCAACLYPPLSWLCQGLQLDETRLP